MARSFQGSATGRMILPFLAASVLTCAAVSQQADPADSYIQATMQWEQIPGLSVAILRDGKLVKSRGYGMENLETNTPASADTVYKIGSVSKQFLAAGMMVLIQEGKAGLDDKVSKYLPDTPASWSSITIRQLLTHTSGIPRDSPAFDPLKVQPDMDILRSVYASPLRFAPGSQFGYSNLNYYGVAEIIRRISGMPWSDFIARKVIGAAGLKSTRTTSMIDIVPNRASGYETVGGKVQNAEIWLATRPSGAFLSTVLDFAQWSDALTTDKVLSAATRSQMWTPVQLSSGSSYGYGFGWFVGAIQGHRRIYHSGGVPGFCTEVDIFPNDNLTVVIMANIGQRDLSDMALHLAGLYRPTLAIPEPAAISDSAPLKASVIASALSDLTHGKEPSGPFSQALRDSLGKDATGRLAQILTVLGPVLSVEPLDRSVKDGVTNYQFRVRYGSIELFVDASIHSDGEVIKFALHD